ncbi:MAG: nitroreductase [Arenimonas sp.]
MDLTAGLLHRHSTPVRLLGEPGPDAGQLQQILRCAVHVPDHGKLTPWRFLNIKGHSRALLGELLVARTLELHPGAAAAQIAKDRDRFNRAPLIIAVIARLTAGHKVPEQEQLLSGGAVCLSMLLAADALGFGAQWLTGWAAYDPKVCARLGLGRDERVLGFIHLGTAIEPVPDRERPDPQSLLSELRL